MRRTNDFSPHEGKPTPISLKAVSRLHALALAYRGILAIAGGLMLISTGISLSLPLVTRQALDGVLKTRSIAGLDRLGLGLVCLILIGAALGYVQYILVALAGNRIVREMRARLFAHLQRLPVAYFDRSRSGDLASYLSNDVSLLQQSLTDD